MPNQTGAQKNKTAMPLEERLKETSMKTMEKAVQQQTMSRLQAGESPNDIISSLLKSVGQQPAADPGAQFNQLAQIPVPRAGSMTGIVPALLNKIKGGSFDPLAPRTSPLGIEGAAQIMNLQNNMQGEQRRAAKDQRQIPLENATLMSRLLNIVKETGNPEIAQAIGVDPNFATQRIERETEARGRAQIRTKQDEARKDFRKDLDEYLELDEFIQRGDGYFGSMKAGVRSQIKRFGGDTEAAAIATRRGLVNRMVPKLARLSSEVGNLNIFEQLAQRELVPGEAESKKTAQLKNSFLVQLSRAVDSKDESAVRKVINRFIESDAFDKKNNMVYDSFDTARTSNLKPGSIVAIKDKSGRYRQFRWKGNQNGEQTAR